MTAPRLVIFDCDGTLVDGQHAITGAMAGAFALHDLPKPEPAAVRRVVGLSLDDAIALLHPAGEARLRAALADAYKQCFTALRARPDHREPLYPGMMALIEALDDGGVLLGVATGKALRGVRHTLAMHGLEDRFVTLQTPDNAPGKPDPGMVLQAMAETGAAPATTLVVGDTSFDMAMARAAGVAALGVAWGYHEADELSAHGAHRVAASAAELGELIAATLGAYHPAP